MTGFERGTFSLHGEELLFSRSWCSVYRTLYLSTFISATIIHWA